MTKDEFMALCSKFYDENMTATLFPKAKDGRENEGLSRIDNAAKSLGCPTKALEALMEARGMEIIRRDGEKYKYIRHEDLDNLAEKMGFVRKTKGRKPKKGSNELFNQ